MDLFKGGFAFILQHQQCMLTFKTLFYDFITFNIEMLFISEQNLNTQIHLLNSELLPSTKNNLLISQSF